MNSLDDIRAKYPHLGIALYAYKPGAPVTLELMTEDGWSQKFTAPTEAEAVARAFADEDEPTPPPVPATNVFD